MRTFMLIESIRKANMGAQASTVAPPAVSESKASKGECPVQHSPPSTLTEGTKQPLMPQTSSSNTSSNCPVDHTSSNSLPEGQSQEPLGYNPETNDFLYPNSSSSTRLRNIRMESTIPKVKLSLVDPLPSPPCSSSLLGQLHASSPAFAQLRK